jgi:hypothetical protein
MPIDEALANLEGVPEYLLKETLDNPLTIPKTIEELQEMYKDNLNISIYKHNPIFLGISFNELSEYKLEYIVRLNYINSRTPLQESTRAVFLIDKDDGIYQSIKCGSSEGFWEYIDEYMKYLPHNVDEGIKKTLEKWFHEVEDKVLENIPELEEFVKNYAN